MCHPVGTARTIHQNTVHPHQMSLEGCGELLVRFCGGPSMPAVNVVWKQPRARRSSFSVNGVFNLSASLAVVIFSGSSSLAHTAGYWFRP